MKKLSLIFIVLGFSVSQALAQCTLHFVYDHSTVEQDGQDITICDSECLQNIYLTLAADNSYCLFSIQADGSDSTEYEFVAGNDEILTFKEVGNPFILSYLLLSGNLGSMTLVHDRGSDEYRRASPEV